MKNKTTIYKFPKEGYYSFLLPEMPLKITISCDGSNAVISSSKRVSLLYFRKLFNHEKPKKMLKQEYTDLFKNVGPIEMHPFFDEKEHFAGAYENNFMVFKVSKNSLNINEAKKLTNQHKDNIRFLAWQYKQNGLLASTSSDKVIKMYDIRSARNPVFEIIDDDVVKNIKFSIVNYSYLATGYHKRLKIWDLKKSTTTPIIVKEIFDGSVDIIEWHSTQNQILCGSKQTNVIKVFSVKDCLELILEIKIKDVDENYENSQKILKAFFIHGNGIIAVCERKAFLYHIENKSSNAILDQEIHFHSSITNFKIMTNNLNNNYLVYTDKNNNFIARQYTLDENIKLDKNLIQNNLLAYDKDRNILNNKRLLFLKDIENVKKKYPGNVNIENKEDKNVYLLKLAQDLITIKVKVTYNEDYPKTLPSVEFENKYENFLIDKTLISNINNEISYWQANNMKPELEFNYNSNPGVIEILVSKLMKILNFTRIQIEENADDNAKRLLRKPGKIVNNQTAIIPYVRTCSHTWGPKSQIITFNYNKIDLKQLKQRDKTITNFNNLEDWIKFCEAKDGRTKFSRSENKLIEEESDIIITESLRNLIEIKPMKDLTDNLILNAINRVESLPNLFINVNLNGNFNANGGHSSIDPNNESNLKINKNIINSPGFFQNSQSFNDLNLLLSDDNFQFAKKKWQIFVNQINGIKNNFILENLKIKLLSKDHFYASISSLLQYMKTSEVTLLLDILNIINFNINSIIDPANTAELLVKHYKNVIMTCIKTLESKKNYEYLYICILLITSRIFDSVIRDILKVPSLMDVVGDNVEVNLRQNFKYIKSDCKRRGKLKKSQISLGSERIIPTRPFLRSETYNVIATRIRSSSLERFDGDSNKFESVMNDEYSDYQLNESIKDITYVTHISQIEEDKDDNEEYFEDSQMLHGINLDLDNIKDKPRDLIHVFGDNILSKFIDFLYFYSNELYRLNRINERAELIKFLYLISSKLKINKLKTILDNSSTFQTPLINPINKRKYSLSVTEKNNESESLYNKFRLIDDKYKKKIFKTKLLNNKEYISCDICGERLKIGGLSIYCPFFNIKGHFDHVNDYIICYCKLNQTKQL